MKRRTFLSFLGYGTAGLATAPLWSAAKMHPLRLSPLIPPAGLEPSGKDALLLAEGLRSNLLISWQDPINAGERFGFNNDYLAFIPQSDPNEGILWVNHESVDPLFVSGYQNGTKKTREQVMMEMKEVGGSVIKIRKDTQGLWKAVVGDSINRRLDGNTEIPFNWDEEIAGKSTAMGTLGNCAGGITPWNTILTCEENYQDYYGERDKLKGKRYGSIYNWETHFPRPPEHYGWVTEVNPQTGHAQKHIALGRCSHECATVKELADGRLVVYTGDDDEDQCLYKFISSEPRSLRAGTLYVANLAEGRWIPLDIARSPVLQKHFPSQTEVLIRLRQSAALVGGTPLDRPEDIEIDPNTGHILIALTNNRPGNNHFGSILKVMESGGRYDSLTFSHDTFLTGGEETGFACPDNMAFDKAGNLWFTSDISGSALGKEPYKAFGNNSLFVVMREGSHAGKAIRMANAPVNAEFTGPCFSPDGKTLFLSVQHPGEKSSSPDQPLSHWPDGGSATPRPSVVTIYGEALEKIQGL